MDFDPEQGPGPGRVRAAFCIGFPLCFSKKGPERFSGASRRILYRIIHHPLIPRPGTGTRRGFSSKSLLINSWAAGGPGTRMGKSTYSLVPVPRLLIIGSFSKAEQEQGKNTVGEFQ